MKKFFVILAVLALSISSLFLLSGCGNSDGKSAQNRVVRVGVAGTSDEKIWKHIIDEFKSKNVDIKLVVFSDYTQPNAALANKEIEMNAFQHNKFLNSEIKKHGYNITPIGNTLLAALNLYSRNVKSVKDIKAGDKIALPNDTVNFGRSLNVLQAAGLIKLKPDASVTPELQDIKENPLNLKLVQVDAAQTASLLPDVAAAVINGQYSADAGLDTNRDAIFRDAVEHYKTDDFINVIAVRTEDKDNPLYQEIVKAYQSDKTKEVYKNDFHDLYIPAWSK